MPDLRVPYLTMTCNMGTNLADGFVPQVRGFDISIYE
jgi:hypothetical protein